jgi:hypothetical protein
VLLPAAIVFVLFILALELALLRQGIHPTVTDSEARWQRERNRADDLGGRALILVGASRMQIDIDLDEARRLTRLEPEQLAVSGANWIPIFQGLANDPEINGTVLVDFDERFVAEPDTASLHVVNDALVYQQHFRRRRLTASPSERAEAALDGALHKLLRSYADDATPWQSLVDRAFGARSTQYIDMAPDRSRAADFARTCPTAILPRSLANGGRVIPLAFKSSTETRRAELAQLIPKLRPEDDTTFLDESRLLHAAAKAIELRGGHVFFIRMPLDGWMKQSYERRYPRAKFWDRFAAEINGGTLNYSDHESLSKFTCPDAFHLDYRDRRAFTASVIRELGLRMQ